MFTLTQILGIIGLTGVIGITIWATFFSVAMPLLVMLGMWKSAELPEVK